MQGPPVVDELQPPNRTLMGPGPSDVHPRVLGAMNKPLLGHLDAAFLEVMDEVQELLRYVFQTSNEFTIPVSGTGSAAMESVITSLVSPGDVVLIAENGYFGDRMAEMAARAGGEVSRISAPWGEPLDTGSAERALKQVDPDLFGFVHMETSTGVLQPEVATLTELAHEAGALTIIDTVASLGGVEFRTDDWDVDVVYSGAQKCLSCPPGVSPVTLSDTARDRLLDRTDTPRSWYLDLALLAEYWGDERTYHHTAPISNVYALRESLRIVAEEGLEQRWERHERVASGLQVGLEALGLDLATDEAHWSPSLTTVHVPDGVDPDTVISRLLAEYGIEIAGGLGNLAGEIFRIGCMGYSARSANVLHLISALGQLLADEGAKVDVDAGVAAASGVLSDGSDQTHEPSVPM